MNTKIKIDNNLVKTNVKANNSKVLMVILMEKITFPIFKDIKYGFDYVTLLLCNLYLDLLYQKKIFKEI